MVDGFDDDIDELEDNVEGLAVDRDPRAHLEHPPRHPRTSAACSRRRATRPGPCSTTGSSSTATISLFPRDIELHFADAYDKLLRATDGLDLSRDLLAGVRDFHQARSRTIRTR